MGSRYRASKVAVPKDAGRRAGRIFSISKRVVDVDELTVTRDRFASMLDGGAIIPVDPSHCVPYTRIRCISDSGVNRLMHSFSKSKKAPGLSRGPSSAAGLPIVTEPDDSARLLIIEFLTSEHGLTAAESAATYQNNPHWYGVIDGSHRLIALNRLAAQKPGEFAGYTWYVLKVRGGHMDLLKAFARDCNEKLRKEHVVGFALFDTLRNLKDVANDLLTKNSQELTASETRSSRGFKTLVADTYCGGKGAATDPTRQLAGIAIRLTDEVIDCMGEILNGEFPDLARTHFLRTRRHNSREEPVIDHRVFQKIVNTSTIRGASVFLKAQCDEDRINALHRAQYFSMTNGFKGLSPEKLNSFTVAATLARKEAAKMVIIFGSEVWPSQLEAARKKLRRTGKFDDEVQRNSGNDTEVIKSLADLYKRHYPLVASRRLRSFRTRNSRSTTALNEEREHDKQGRKNDCDGEAGQNIPEYHSADVERNESHPVQLAADSHTGTERSHHLIEGSQQDRPNDRPEARDISRLLERFNFSAHQMKWQDFERTILTDEGIFEMIIADPAYCLPTNQSGTGNGYNDYIDDKEMTDFSQFARRVLVPGGCCLIFTSFQLFMRWAPALQAANMKVIRTPMIFVKDTETLQRTRRERMPQCGCEIAIVSWSPGSHPSNFRTDFSSPYSLIKCAHKRKFAVVDNIPVPRNKLKYPGRRKVIRIEEKSTLLLAELLKTFCPENGRVLDPYAGTMTTAITCLASGRPCTVVEKDPECYRFALERIQTVAERFCENESFSRSTRSRTEQSPDESLILLTNATGTEPSQCLDEVGDDEETPEDEEMFEE